MRQIALIARELAPVVDEIREVFGLEVAYRDPEVAAFGLENAVFPVGNQFLEVVAPVREGTAGGRYLDRRGGDGGYMVILQSAALDEDRRRLAALGVRVVWQMDLDDIRGTHLHPADVGGAILSIDDARPASSWRWAGPGWERHARTEVAETIAGVELAAPDPEALAARWSRVLDRPVKRPGPGRLEITLAPGTLRFVRGAAARGAHVRGYDVRVRDRPGVLAAARARGLAVEDDALVVAGTHLALV